MHALDQSTPHWQTHRGGSLGLGAKFAVRCARMKRHPSLLGQMTTAVGHAAAAVVIKCPNRSRPALRSASGFHYLDMGPKSDLEESSRQENLCTGWRWWPATYF